VHDEKMSEQRNKKAVVVVVSGPSGVGKTTICEEVVKRIRDVYLSVSVTTRAKAQSEVDGEDYRFISKEQFQQSIDEGLLLEWAEVFGNQYGTPKDKVEEALAAGLTVVLGIDVQGARQAKLKYPDAVLVFILPPSDKELAQRLSMRGREGAEAAEERLDEASAEIAAAWQFYPHKVVNEDLEQAVNEVIEIIEQARSKSAVTK
jgi:guanylate kinase